MTALIVEAPVCARLTVAPVIGLAFASLSVTVTVDVVDPSATTETGLAVSVDVSAFTANCAAFTMSTIVCTSDCVAGLENKSGCASI